MHFKLKELHVLLYIVRLKLVYNIETQHYVFTLLSLKYFVLIASKVSRNGIDEFVRSCSRVIVYFKTLQVVSPIWKLSSGSFPENSHVVIAADDSLITEDEWSTMNDDELNASSFLNQSSNAVSQVNHICVFEILL